MSYYIKLENKEAANYLLCYNIQVMKIVMLYYFILNIKNDYFFKKYIFNIYNLFILLI